MKKRDHKSNYFYLCAILLVLAFWSINPVFGDGTNQTGYYEVRANVENASVFLDGVAVGTIQGGTLLVPAEISNKPVNHNLMIKADGYKVYNETVIQAPKAGKNIILKGTLIRVPITPVGAVYLAVSPPGADVTIDDVPRGVVGQSGILVLRDVPAGNRIINIHLDGYQDRSERTYVEANMDNQVRITLVPLTTGSVEVTSEPGSASVMINGVPAGITPVIIPNVTAGEVDVRLTLSGYQDWAGSTSLQAGKTALVSATLIPVPTSAPEPVSTTEVPTSVPTPEPTATTTPISPIIGVVALGALCLFWRRRE